MKISKESLSKHLFLQAGLALLLFSLSTSAFHSKIARRIKKEADGYCENCGVYAGNMLIAAHLIHGRKEREYGKALCRRCETKYHLAHADNPLSIGLSKRNNDATVYGHVLSLSEDDQQELQRQYDTEWEGVLKRLNR